MLKMILASSMGLMMASTASALIIGVNIHDNTDQRVSDLMKSRNLKSARIDLTVDSDVNATRAMASRVRANGGQVEASVQISYQWDNSCPQNFAVVEQNSYNETKTLVNKYKDVIYDYELLNEVQLRPEAQNEVTWNSAGTSVTPYNNKACYKSLASVLRGMSRAIHDVRDSSGYPLRVMLGVVGRDFGFLTFMKQQNVSFDVVGFHIYPHAGDTSLLNDPWYGSGGPFAQLAAFGLPIHVNEFNCAEIYDGNYDNKAGSATTKACFNGYKNHIPSFFNQKVANIESIHLYELFDEPGKAAPENRFGLMYDLNTPKTQLLIVSAFAGGMLSASEQQSVVASGALTDAQIASYKALAGNAPEPSLSPSVPQSSLSYAKYTHTQYVTSLYRLLLGREPDSASLKSYVASLNKGTSRVAVQTSFLSSAEYKSRVKAMKFAPASSLNSLSNADYVQTLYIVLLGRDADAGGLTGYVEALNQGASRTDIFRSIITSGERQAIYPGL